eukprot:1622573-Pyramimonas_sp.AAC.1
MGLADSVCCVLKEVMYFSAAPARNHLASSMGAAPCFAGEATALSVLFLPYNADAPVFAFMESSPRGSAARFPLKT